MTKTKYQLEPIGILKDDGINLFLADGTIWTIYDTIEYLRVK